MQRHCWLQETRRICGFADRSSHPPCKKHCKYNVFMQNDAKRRFWNHTQGGGVVANREPGSYIYNKITYIQYTVYLVKFYHWCTNLKNWETVRDTGQSPMQIASRNSVHLLFMISQALGFLFWKIHISRFDKKMDQKFHHAPCCNCTAEFLRSCFRWGGNSPGRLLVT